MRIMIGFVTAVAMVLMPLIVFAVTQPGTVETKTTWIGGPLNSEPDRVDSASLADIMGKASVEAITYGHSVVYKTEDGTMMYEAYPDYGRSRCGFVHGKTWEDGRLTQSKVIEVYNRNYELSVPYVPRVLPIPSVR